MRLQSLILATSGALMAIMPSVALAQDAAESAIILSGSGQTGGAQRSLGNSIAGSINRASSAIATTRSSGRAAAPGNSHGAVQVGAAIPAGIDALEGVDATSYALPGGATIRTTGRLDTSAGARCVSQCERVGQAARD